MFEEFVIPKHGQKSVLQEAEVNQAPLADILEELSDHDALYITEDEVYRQCEQVARCFLQLPGRQRAQAVDAFAANLASLCSSAQNLLVNYQEASAEALLCHKNGLKMLVYLLHMIAMHAQRDAEKMQGTENAAATKKPAGRGRKAAAAAEDEDSGSWDWSSSRQGVLLVIHDVMQVDLKALFKGLAAAERLVHLCMELALLGLDSPTIVHVKQEAAWSACQDVLVRGAVLYQQLEFVAGALMERARKHEHMPLLAARMAKYAEEQYNSTQLGVMLLSEFCRASPEDYDTQYGTNQVSVRLAGDVVLLLAEQLPKVVSNQVSQLRPYLGCAKAHCLRGALMAATGNILVQVFRADALNSSMGEGAAQAHLRSKEALLALLHERLLDKAALVRQKVLQTWGRLVEESCVPLSHWNFLLGKAIDRLQDESQLVVKAAVQLLYRMVHQSIFQPPLKLQVYLNTLQQAEEELAKLQPTDAEEQDEEEQEGAEAAAGPQQPGDRDAGACWEKGGIQIKEEGVDQDMADQQHQQPKAEASAAGRGAGHDAAVQRLRTLVASLKEGASFCKRLTAALPQLQALLANQAAGVVHDVIVLLTLCKTYEVQGAAKALRGMWPLVFSKQEPVRQAVLDSWHVLHLHDKLGKQQLEELLVNVIPDSSMSEMTALETIIASLVQQDKLAAGNLMRLLVHDICLHYQELRALLAQQQQQQQEKFQAASRAADGDCSSGMDVDGVAQQDQQDDKLDSTTATLQSGLTLLRHCFTLLSLLAAAKPSALDVKFIPVLLEVGFSSSLPDAWVARHTCLALRSAAPCLVPVNAWTAAGSSVQQTSAGAAQLAAAAGEAQELSEESLQAVLAGLVRLLVAPPAADMAPNWPSSAEAAMAALYALSPRPQELVAAILEEMFRRCKPGVDGGSAATYGASAAALSRFFFVLGRAALQHLLCVEQLGKAIRAARLAADRAAAEAAERQRDAAAAAAGSRKGRGGAAAAAAAENEDIGAQLGVGSVAADAELDALTELVEAQMLAKDQLLGRYGQLLSSFCHLKRMLELPRELLGAALLSLTQLMAVDMSFCANNIALLFTLLVQRHVSADIRVNMVVALADLASRFPNVLEPWTDRIYQTLADPEPAVRVAALASLTHLVLGGMVKGKGNVAEVALLLVDDEPEIVDRAVLFFESLAKTGSGNSKAAASAAAGASSANPVYNLLPDCLSKLLAKSNLLEEQVQVIMMQLLAYVKDKQAESLRERLVSRLQLGGQREWRLVAWCIGQLGYSEKGMRRIIELTPSYRHTLAETQVYDMFMTLADKARKNTGGAKAAAAAAASSIPAAPGDLRAAVEDWVADLAASREAAVEAAEVEEAAARQQQQEQSRITTAAAAAAAATQPEAPPSGIDADMEDEAAGGDGLGEEEAAVASTAAAASHEGVAASSSTVIEGSEQIVLLQLPDAQPDDDAENGEALVAAARRQQQVLDHMQRLSLASDAAAAGKRPAGRAAAKSTTAAAGRRSTAAAAKGSTRGGCARAPAGTRASGRRAAMPSSDNADDVCSGSGSDGDDDDNSCRNGSSSADEHSDDAGRAVQRRKPDQMHASGSSSSRSAGAPHIEKRQSAPRGSTGRWQAVAVHAPAAFRDFSSEEDDD